MISFISHFLILPLTMVFHNLSSLLLIIKIFSTWSYLIMIVIYVISQKSHYLGSIFVLPTNINIQVLVSTNVCSPHMVINTMIGTADYDYFEYCLQSVDWQSLLCLRPCATESCSAFISTLRCFIDECVPHKERVCVRGKRKCKPREVRRCDLKKT